MKNNPLINVSCEIRFDSSFEDSNVCDSLKDCINKRGMFQNKFVEQEITTLPDRIRRESKHLRYVPYHLIEENDKTLGIGPHVLLAEKREYIGFEDFASFVKIGIDCLSECEIKQIEQIRLIYINKIEESIAKSTDLHFAIDKKEFDIDADYTFRIKYDISEECRVILRVCNQNAFLPEQADENAFSVVDLRAIYDIKDSSNVFENLSVAHNNIKDVFRKVMKKSYLKDKWGFDV